MPRFRKLGKSQGFFRHYHELKFIILNHFTILRFFPLLYISAPNSILNVERLKCFQNLSISHHSQYLGKATPLSGYKTVIELYFFPNSTLSVSSPTRYILSNSSTQGEIILSSKLSFNFMHPTS